MFRSILHRLRKWILEWLSDGTLSHTPAGDPLSLNIRVMRPGGEVVMMKAISVSGLTLICQFESGEYLVTIDNAENREHWKAVWRHLGGILPTWQDGTPYEFPT